MKIINKKNNQIIFRIEINESLANAIRRYLNQIPIPAVDEVEILKNDSPLYDETIAHRIGLIPLKKDKTITEKTPPKLKLSVKKEGIVYSKELSGAKVVYEGIPITFLKKDQELEIIATVKIGTGNEHSKFSPGLMFYRNAVDIKIDSNCPLEVVEACPQKILKIKNEKIVAEESYKCDMCEACTDICKKQKKDSIKFIPTKELIISLESFGQLSTNEIFRKSIEALKKDLASTLKKIK